MIAAHGLDRAAFAEVKTLLAREGLHAEPAFVPTYSAMNGMLQQGVCTLGWATPIVSRNLLGANGADPVALVLRGGAQSYYSAIVAKTGSRIWHVGQLERARIGWVSRLSAAGYVVPRAYLAARGISLPFARGSFFETHARAAAALETGVVDVIATYAMVCGRAIHVPLVAAAHPLVVAGPIPGELVVASSGTDAGVVLAARAALTSAKLGRSGALASLGVSGFVHVPDHHLDSLSHWGGSGAVAWRTHVVCGQLSHEPVTSA